MSSAITARDVPVTDTKKPATARRSRLLRPLLMLGGIAAVAIGSGYFWLHGGRYVSIDNAYVRADKLVLSTDVTGIIGEQDQHRDSPARIRHRLNPAPMIAKRCKFISR